MKLKTTIFFCAALLGAQGVFAQKVTDKDISVEYKRLPLEPLPMFNYKSRVELAYLADNAAKKAEHEQQVRDAEAKYELEMKEWQLLENEAEAKYQKELEEWNKKSAAQKLIDKKILEEGKPVKQSPPRPYKNLPQSPNLKKEYDTSLLTSSYLKLDGFKDANDNAVIVTAQLHGFDVIPPILKTSQRSVISNGQASPVTYCYYETSYKHPMTIKVEVPGKGVVFNQAIEEFNTYTVAKTAETKGTSQAMNTESYLTTLEDKVLADNLKVVTDLLNTKFGYTKMTHEAVLYNVEPKKLNYDDYQSAYENAMMGYTMMADNKAGATEKIKTAIGIWEKALTESNLSDKKARVNAEITLATRFNLAEAYTWIDDYTNAELQLVKITTLDPSRKERKYAENLEAFIKDQKVRYKANKK